MTAPRTAGGDLDRADGPRIGLDIGGTKTHAVLLSAAGEILAEERLRTGHGGPEVVATALRATRRVLAVGGVEAEGLAGIGVGVPGTVDHVRGVVTQALNLGVEHLPLAQQLNDVFGRPVHVENDVNAAALGVALLADGGADGVPTGLRTAPSLAYLNLGTGLAVGLVLDGALWRGARGAAGEIGHLPLDPQGPPCHCGQRGCLETMASGSGIAHQWRVARSDPPPKARALMDLATTDPLARTIADRLIWAVASAVRAIVLSLDVPTVVLGGGVTRLGDQLVSPVRALLETWEESSPFLASLGPGARVRLLDHKAPVAAVGAALAGALPVGPA